MIALCAGHYPSSPGACWDGRCEHQEAMKWVEFIAQIMGKRYAQVIPPGRLQDKVGAINGQRFVLAIDLHFNSDPEHGGTGCETLYCPGSQRGFRAAEIVHAPMATIMKPDRGIKRGWYRMDPGQGIDYFLRSTDCPALILEPEFIHNHAAIDTKRDACCEAIAEGLLAFYKMHWPRF